jgi:hypothetical protein
MVVGAETAFVLVSRLDRPATTTVGLEGVKDFMVTLVLARTNPGAISVARNALRRV